MWNNMHNKHHATPNKVCVAQLVACLLCVHDALRRGIMQLSGEWPTSAHISVPGQ